MVQSCDLRGAVAFGHPGFKVAHLVRLPGLIAANESTKFYITILSIDIGVNLHED